MEKEKKPSQLKPERAPAGPQPAQTPVEDMLEFLAYLDRHGLPVRKEDPPRPQKRKSAFSNTIPRLNLEEGMPLVEEALRKMNLGLQEMRVSGIRTVKLIHGYGSTGQGGRIRAGVRNELVSLKRKNLIKGYIPGEDFGPMDASARRLAEQNSAVTRDPDYGRFNHGITIVIL